MSERILDEHEVRRLLPMGECIDVMADALASLARGEVHNPLRFVVRPPDETSLLGLMPAHRGGDDKLWGLKTVAIFPGNSARGLDSHQGFVALFDGETGETRAILNAGGITAVRLEALTHPSLPGNGPGRYPGRAGRFRGTFSQESWKVTATPPNRKNPITLVFDNGWADHQLQELPVKSNGQWNIAVGGEGRNCTAVWSLSKPASLAAGHEKRGRAGAAGADYIAKWKYKVNATGAMPYTN